MDAQRLYHVFTASFDSDPNVRIAAELELKKLEPVEGLLPTLLQLVAPAGAGPQTPSTPVVRLAAAIYLKNRIRSSWKPLPSDPSSSSSLLQPPTRTTQQPSVPIPPSDRQSLKTNLIPLYAALSADSVENSAKVKEQVGEALAKVIECEFPHEWPGLVQEIQGMLGATYQPGDGNGNVEAGLRATAEVFNTMRYAARDETGEILVNLATHLLPLLLPLANQILSPASAPSTPQALAHQGTLLRLILKSYKNSIIHTLTPAHQAHEAIVPWGTLLLQIVSHPLDPSLLPSAIDDPDLLEKHPWSRTKKWACWSLNRLFTRYGCPTSLPKNLVKQYGPFAERFVAQFAPEIFKTYLAAVEKMVRGEWFPKKGKYHILCFFEECINPKSMFALLKPHLSTLIEHFIFPLVCLTEDEIEMFNEDPAEYARQFFGDFIADSYASPTATALAFLSTLVETRAKTSLLPLLQFIQSVVDKYPAQTTPRQKDGALRMLGALCNTAVKSKKLAPMLESFFVQYIVPEFKSPHGFLRSRACDLVEKYESVDMVWADQNALENTLNCLMNCITDSDLPVRIQAACALPELVRYERIRERMLPNLGRILQELLKLSSEVDLDALTNTTRSMVAEFSEEVVPFALELSQSLAESYRRLLQESLESRNNPNENGVESYDDEKTLVMMNVLKTIEQLVSSAKDKKELVTEMEKGILPLLEATIRNQVVELFDETYEILDSLSFFQQTISPAMWACFEATYSLLKQDTPDYIHEMFGFLDNCVNYGADVLSTNTEYRRCILEIFDMCMTSRALGAEDRVIACKLAEAMLLRLRGQIDEAVPLVVERCMSFVLSKGDDDDFVVTMPLFLHSLELVILAIAYNSQLTIAILDRHDWTQQFFAQWFKSLRKYTRVHDKKIVLWAICSLFEWLNGVGAGSPLAGNAAQLVAGALEVFKTYPRALAERKVAEANRDLEVEEVDDDEMSDDEEEDLDFGDEDEDEEPDVRDRTTDYLDELAATEAQRAARLAAFDDGDSGWSDEILWASPLDQFDSYERFSNLLATLQAQNPTLYQAALSALDTEQQAVLSDVAAKAAEGGDAVVAVKAFEAMQAEEDAPLS
ncbi:ARM repeat-containing protein [Rhodotorula sp. JG-1b]|nr:ARM repeat-containing protein [Rhodotorula sp. JG-1b]